MEKKNTIETQEKNMNRAFATSDLYQLLSLSLQAPTIELVEAMLDGSYKQDGISILMELSGSQEELTQLNEAFDQLNESANDASQLLIEMSQELTKLFYHPNKPIIYIYETLFLNHSTEIEKEGMLFLSPTALDVERSYKDAGVIQVKKTGEPSDHIATELEFMMFLYARKGKAIQEQNLEVLHKTEQQIKQFEQMHFGKWGYDFFVLLEAESRSGAYKVIAQLAKLGVSKVLTKAIYSEIVR